MSTIVSLIIPTYNRALLIEETLDSILEQTYQNWECIIVDDGSSDNTVEVVNQYLEKDTRFQFYRRPENRLKGANACRNFGIENSKGEYMMFLDSDDICEPFCLAERVNKVVSDSSIHVLIRDTALLIGTEKKSKTINKDPEIYSDENYLRMFLSYDLPWPIMGAFYKREVLATCKFDENLRRFQDVSLNIKVLSRIKNLKISRDFKIDTYYRMDDQKVTSEGFVSNTFESLLVFYEIHGDLLKHRLYKLDFRKFSSKIILQFVTRCFYQNRMASNKVMLWAIKSNIYTLSQKRTLFLLLFCLNSNLYKVKGFGMYKLRNKVKQMTHN
ncbi:glycosyltransferase [Flavobacterium sp. GA093]|uniref:Glycosyltransferase n=1 Tax=Flavobacterium hydrocarbonoxydans TaxID=2683249 RepID=A0A6I4NJ34_9FLAO|nr:glycosyltransferase family 2 protein [Flavobacterium hydrocarbonoxydans]MWB94506.1 glycosyltransferase [Flavobacterium hydrocarbonoxydans]